MWWYATGAALHGVVADHAEVEVPATGLRSTNRSTARSLDRERGQPGRDAEALLGAGVGDVDAPAVDVDRDAAERGDAVDEQQGVALRSPSGAMSLRTPVDVSACTTAITLGDGWAASEALGVDRLAPRRLDASRRRRRTGAATSHMRSPNTPLTPTTTASPGPTRFTKAASMPAEPVPLIGSVSAVVGAEHRDAAARAVSSRMARKSGSRWPSSGRANASTTSGYGLLGPGPISRRSPCGIRRRLGATYDSDAGVATERSRYLRAVGDTLSRRAGSVPWAPSERRIAKDSRYGMAELTVMTWNVQNLFPPGTPDGPATEEEYEAKLAALAGVIDDVGPDVLALQEVGDPSVLADLDDACVTPLGHRAVGVPDDRGIRVALLSGRKLSNHQDIRTFPAGLVPIQVADVGVDDPLTTTNEALSTSGRARHPVGHRPGRGRAGHDPGLPPEVEAGVLHPAARRPRLPLRAPRRGRALPLRRLRALPPRRQRR